MVHDQLWKINIGRSIDPFSISEYDGSAKCKLHNFTEKNELEFFMGCFPSSLVRPKDCL